MTGTLFKRRWFWIVTPALLVIAIVAVTHFISSREPRYHGRPLSYWVDQLPTTVVFSNGFVMFYSGRMNITSFPMVTNQQQLIIPPGPNGEARRAIDELGGKCVPYLLSRLRAWDPAWKIVCADWAMRLHITKTQWRQNNDLTAGQAVTALEMLGAARLQLVVPELLKLANDKNPSVRDQARYLLKKLEEPPPKAKPPSIRLARAKGLGITPHPGPLDSAVAQVQICQT